MPPAIPEPETNDIFEFHPGQTPLLISMPHVGTAIPESVASQMTDAARLVADTDWHVDRLYDFAAATGAGLIRPRYSRYVIDLNRAPDDRPLYPGANNTELVPTTTFADEDIYLDGALPDAAEIDCRRVTFWQPYHQRIERALTSIRERDGIAVLFDCHSIKSRVPRFFAGALPDFNLGTGDGRSCADGLRDRLAATLRQYDRYSTVVDGRFKGGYITRRYGRPDNNVHAFQLELSQATYMDEAPPFAFVEVRARQVRPTLKAMVETATAWAQAA